MFITAVCVLFLNTAGMHCENLFRLVPVLGHDSQVLPLEPVPVPRHGAQVLPLEPVPVPGHGAQISARAPTKNYVQTRAHAYTKFEQGLRR